MTPRMTTQLEKDLLVEARGRLQTWAKDTAMRCQAADLDDWQIRAIFMALSTELMFVTLPRKTKLADFLHTMELLFRKSEKFKEKSHA